MPLLQAIMPIDVDFIKNHFLETLACIYIFTVLANLLDQEEDKNIQYILHKKFIYSSLAIIVVAKAVYKDLLYTTAAVQKYKDI